MRRLGMMVAVLAVMGAARAAEVAPQVHAADPVAAGKYLVTIGGCNDCHTAGWRGTPDGVPADRLLTGNPVGYQGPWGVTYAVNLRTYIHSMTVAKWIETARTLKARPPMPNYNLMSMSDADLRAVYAYIHALGPAGAPAPDSLQPGQTATGPVVVMVPQAPK
jgi:mono/diheme cytochrome c family protein